MDNLSPISHPCTSSFSCFGNHTVATVLSRNLAKAFMSTRPLALASAYTFLMRLSFSGETGNRITRSSIPLNHTSSRNTQSNLSEWPSFRRKSRKSATALSNSGNASSISMVPQKIPNRASANQLCVYFANLIVNSFSIFRVSGPTVIELRLALTEMAPLNRSPSPNSPRSRITKIDSRRPSSLYSKSIPHSINKRL